MSVAIEIDLPDISHLLRGVDQIARMDTHDLLMQIGGLVESQTRTRLDEDKETPEGEPWEEWSERYAQTRHTEQSLLIGEGDMLDSVGHLVSGNTVHVGSNLIYAATHHFGDRERGIPARPFLGLSDDDRDEIQQIMTEYIQSLIS